MVRFPIEEKRVETEYAERAFERSSTDSRKRRKSAFRGGILYRRVVDPKQVLRQNKGAASTPTDVMA